MQIHQSILSFHPFRVTLYILTFLYVGAYSVAFGQCDPEETPSLFCEDAPLLCLNQFCFHSQQSQFSCCAGWCGVNTFIHNPQYFEFTPVSPDITIEIHVDECSGGNGLQSAILSACPWDIENVLDCNPGAPPGSTMTLKPSGLMPGQPHWVVIDGSAGSVCDYTFTSVQGIAGVDLSGDAGPLTADPAIFSYVFGTIHFTLANTLSKATGYYWTLSWQTDAIITPGPELDIYTPCFEDPGIYTVCVTAYNGCDTMENEICTTIELLPPVYRIKPPVSLCPEAFPFRWHDILIQGPGTYTKRFYPNIYPGICPFDSIWIVDAYSPVAVGIIDTTVCDSEFYYEDQLYDVTGLYNLHYPGAGQNGCDSVAQLHLSINELNFFVEEICVDTIRSLRPHVIELIPPTDSIFYSWYDCTYDSLLSTSHTFTPDTAGCYCLIAEHGFCSDTICSKYLSLACSQTCSLVQERSCIGDTVLFTYESEIPEGATFHWLIDSPETTGQYYTGNDSIILDYSIPGCYVASLTIVSGDSTFSCRDSICVFSTASFASICCDQTKCDSCATITVELSGASPWTLYFSDATDTDTIFNVRSSPYSHIVCPPYDSTITYQLLVMDSASQCPAIIAEETSVSISLFENPEFSIVQNNDTICIDIQDIADIQWRGCNSVETLSTSPCFAPPSSGCFCADLTSQEGCITTKCYDFIISSVTLIPDTDILIKPIPSSGTFDFHFSSKIQLPVKWTLIDVFGRAIENGNLDQYESTILLKQTPPSGVYYLQIESASHQTMTSKLIIDAQ